MKIKNGRCLCGNISFEVKGAPDSTAICHCRSCQRASGADSVAWVQFPLSEVSWSGGTRARHSSSAGIERTFCPACGSSLSYQNKETSIDLVLACFNDPEAFKPAQEIWLDHRLSWNAIDPSIPGYRQFSNGEQADFPE